MYFYLPNILFQGLNHYKFWLIPLLNTLTYGLPTALIWMFFYRFLNSELLLFFITLLASILVFYINTLHAIDSSLHLVIHNISIYENGKITLLGAIFRFFINPLGFLLIFAGFLLIRKYSGRNIK